MTSKDARRILTDHQLISPTYVGNNHGQWLVDGLTKYQWALRLSDNGQPDHILEILRLLDALNEGDMDDPYRS